MMRDHYDVIVVGGGPAGCTTAALVAEAGFATLLVERQQVPRFHLGESLMPESYWTLDRLGLIERMKASQFVKKVGVQFVNHTGTDSHTVRFRDHDPRDCAETWQVERAEFDKLLFDHAADKGACCRDATQVVDVLFDGSRARGVQLRYSDDRLCEVGAGVVVDATGQQTLLATRLDVKQVDSTLRKAAIWGYYRGAQRDAGELGGVTTILQTESRQSWFWYIPLSDNITSIGVVADERYLLRGRGKPADVYEDEMVKCPALVERLMNAEMVGDLRDARDFPYSVTRHAGDGWVLVGDASGFLDPIFSSGVFFALRAGELAADAIIEGLRRRDVSGNQLGKWTTDFEAGRQRIRTLVDVFYTGEFDVGRFLKERPECRGNLLELLMGRVFHAGDRHSGGSPKSPWPAPKYAPGAPDTVQS